MNDGFKVEKDATFNSVIVSSTLKIPIFDDFPDLLGITGQSGFLGDIIFNTASGFFYGHNGSTWVELSATSGSITLSTEAGESLVFDGIGPDLKLKGLASDGTVVITAASDTVNLSVPGGGAANVTLTNVGVGNSLVDDGVGPDLSIKSLSAGSNIQITDGTDLIIDLINDIVINSITTTFMYIESGGFTSRISQDTLLADAILHIPSDVVNSTFVFDNTTQTLTNKTIDRSLNTFLNLNIVNADVATGANIDNNKLLFFIKTLNNYAWGNGALTSVGAGGGDRNIAFGTNAGSLISSGDDNVCIGTSAGDAISTGSRDICIGTNAGTSITTANDAIIIGTNALPLLSTSANLESVIIGHNVGDSKPDTTTVQSVVIGYHTAGSNFSNQSVQIGYNAMKNAHNSTSLNSIMGYNCFSANANAGSSYNSLVGSSIMRQTTNTCTLNAMLGNGIFDSMSANACSRNVAAGFGTCLATTGASSDNVLVGYNCLSNFTTGSVNNSIIIGNGIQAFGETDTLSNLLALMPNASTLPSGITSNAAILGNSSMTKFVCPGTNFNTNGIVVSSSNELSSTTTVSQQITFSSGIKTDTIDEVSTGAGVTIDGLQIKDSAIQFTAPLSTYEETTATTPGWVGIWSGGAIVFDTNVFITKFGDVVTLSITGTINASDTASFITSSAFLAVAFRPTIDIFGYCSIQNNSTEARGAFVILTTGVIKIYGGDYLTNFSGTGNEGFHNFSVSFIS